MPSRILITGASGLVGTELSKILHQAGYEVVHLSRSECTTYTTYIWDVEKMQIDPKALDDVDYIIHLAGAGVADKRWTDARKKEIYDSRIDSLKLLYTEVEKREKRPKAIISSSAIGYYGIDQGDEWVDEKHTPAYDFLAKVCIDWEAETERFKALGLREVRLRTGLVLSTEGGLLNELVPLANKNLAAPIGSGKQYMSWIDLTDLCEMYHFFIRKEKGGAYNAVAPHPERNNALTLAIAKVLGKTVFLPKVPAFVMKLILGDLAASALGSLRVSAKKVKNAGFVFKYGKLEKSLAHLLK